MHVSNWTSLTSGQNRTIVWNEENRVKSIADQGSTTVFLYDGQGERALKRGQYGETVYVNRFYSVKNGDLASKHVFAGETRVVTKLEKDGGSMQTGVPGANAFTVSQGLPNAMTRGNGRQIGINRRLPGSSGTTTTTNPPLEKFEFFYHGDHLGSSNFITDDSGAVYQDLEYFPYGETWVDDGFTNSRIPNYQFTGKELDLETGLYYGARYYDPVLSRWISADPIIDHYLPTGNEEKDKKLPGSGGVYNPFNLALYTYAHSNPVKLTDPDGNAVFENAVELKKAGQAALKDKSLQPQGSTTHCSEGVREIEEKGGNSDYKGLVANKIIEKLEDKKYGTELTADQAVEYAKKGATVVAGVKGAREGHVAVVAPTDLGKSGSLNKKVPYVYNVGKTMGLKLTSEGFNVFNQPKYYIRNTDKKAIDIRTFFSYFERP